MSAVDSTFLATVKANPHLRPRVGNPDEMKSNRMQRTLDELKFRVTEPEDGIPEAIDGKVITALNEEAIAAAALGNKGGINIIVTYEAFGAKMHGVMRQEIIFAKHRQRMGLSNNWLSIPLSTGHKYTAALGFINEGGTLNRYGMLFINRCTWGHILAETARVLEIQPEDLLTKEELKAVMGKASPEGIIIPES